MKSVISGPSHGAAGEVHLVHIAHLFESFLQLINPFNITYVQAKNILC